MTICAAKQAKALVDPTLAFAGEKFTVFPELARDVRLASVVGRGIVGRGIVVGASGVVAVVVIGPVAVPVVIRTTRGLIIVSGRGVGLISGARRQGVTSIGHSIVFLTLPITAVTFQREVAKLGEAAESRKMEEVVLDPSS
jgi:hypothetical protein